MQVRLEKTTKASKRAKNNRKYYYSHTVIAGSKRAYQKVSISEIVEKFGENKVSFMNTDDEAVAVEITSSALSLMWGGYDLDKYYEIDRIEINPYDISLVTIYVKSSQTADEEDEGDNIYQCMIDSMNYR